jgi:hypothetical protein
VTCLIFRLVFVFEESVTLRSPAFSPGASGQTRSAEIGKKFLRLPVKIDELYALNFEEIKLS